MATKRTTYDAESLSSDTPDGHSSTTDGEGENSDGNISQSYDSGAELLSS